MMEMSTYFRIFLVFFLGLFSICSLRAQGALCSDIEPFCAGDERLTFPNSNNTNSSQIRGETGPDYGCLEEQPYPAWFFLQVEDSGDLTFTISQYENSNNTGAPLDVDFVVWGPFNRGEEYCSGSVLNANKIVDCSYLPDAVETMSIPGAEANQIYVVVITNFEQVPGFISLQQTNSGQGSTDCSILELDLGDQIAVCDENQYTLDGTTDEAGKYEWFVFNENTQQYDLIEGEEGPTLTVSLSGDYKLIVTDLIENKTEEDEVTVTFYNSPVIGDIDNLSICQGENEFIDLTENDDDLIQPNGSQGNYIVNYYDSVESAEDRQPISNPGSFPFEDGKLIYGQVVDNQSGCESELQRFELTTFDFPEYSLPENIIFCVDLNGNLLNSKSLGQDLGPDFTYEWIVDNEIISNNAIVNFNQLPSDNNIRLIITHPGSGCELEFNTIAVEVSRPENVLVEVTGSDFGDGYTVTANLEGGIGSEFAGYEYRLDNNAWRSGNSFNDVSPGSHTVSVREVNGCGETTSESFFLVGYPRFFTPNADGYNDNWNLITDSNITIKKLYVFDRYGKLIKQLDPGTNKGWDGKYNGNDLPADDYWFRVEFIDEKTGNHQEYMSNFTLMR